MNDRLKRTRVRKVAPSEGPAVARPHSRLVETVKLDGVTYVRRYTSCGKRCARCARDGKAYDPHRPGHGPYWYRVYRKVNGGVVRKYIGKNLIGEKGR